MRQDELASPLRRQLADHCKYKLNFSEKLCKKGDAFKEYECTPAVVSGDSGESNSLGIIIGVTVGCVVVFGVLICIICYCVLSRKKAEK